MSCSRGSFTLAVLIALLLTAPPAALAESDAISQALDRLVLGPDTKGKVRVFDPSTQPFSPVRDTDAFCTCDP